MVRARGPVRRPDWCNPITRFSPVFTCCCDDVTPVSVFVGMYAATVIFRKGVVTTVWVCGEILGGFVCAQTLSTGLTLITAVLTMEAVLGNSAPVCAFEITFNNNIDNA